MSTISTIHESVDVSVSQSFMSLPQQSNEGLDKSLRSSFDIYRVITQEADNVLNDIRQSVISLPSQIHSNKGNTIGNRCREESDFIT
jgi:hypothetical protein